MVRGSCVFLLAGIALAAEVKVLEQIVAKVNGDIITRSELDRQRQTLEAELRQRQVPADQFEAVLKEREKDLLKDQIDQLLLVQKSRELSISVDAEITRQLAQIQQEAKITDPDRFAAFVREQTGMPLEDYKQQMKNQLLTRRVIQQEVGRQINIPKAELQKYYEEHKSKFIRKEQVFLREIFLSIAGKTPQQVAAIEKKAKELVARARKGEKFPELARENSDSDSAKNYGEIGWYKRGELIKPIEDLVFKERRGYVTDPVRLENGFLIIKLEERHEEGQAAFEDVESDIMEQFYMQRMEPKVREFLTKLRTDAFLEIREGYIDTGAAPGKDTAWKDPAQLKPETTTKAEVAKEYRRRLFWMIPMPWGGGYKPPAEVDTSTLGTKDSPAAKK